MRGLQEVKGESPKPSSRDQKKDHESKQTEQDKQQTSSELKNRTEQLSETETATAKTPETETAKAPEKNDTQNAPVKPYVNFAEGDFNRTLSVEKVLEKL